MSKFEVKVVGGTPTKRPERAFKRLRRRFGGTIKAVLLRPRLIVLTGIAGFFVFVGTPHVGWDYEAHIDKLERQKIVLAERVETTVPPKGRLEDCINSRSVSWQALGIYAKMMTSLCARQCLDWSFQSHLNTVKMGCMKLPNYRSLSGT